MKTVPMPFLDLTAQYRSIRHDIDSAIQRVVTSAKFIQGEEGDALEKEVASYCGVRHGIALNSGTDALFLSLKALGIGQGDEVITTPFTFVATAEMIAATGATPVFVDTDDNLLLDVQKISGAVTARTKAVIPVDLFGFIPDMDAMQRIADKYSLAIIEDAAQSIGATYGERKAGAFGTCACISFFPAKNLGAYGDAGMVVTDSDELANTLRLLRNHGSQKKYHHEILGYSSRLDEMQAAILLAKLPHLDGWNERRQAVAVRYSDALRDVPGVLAVPVIPENRTCVFQQYTIRVQRRNELQGFLKSVGIPTAVHYPIPLHLQPSLAFLGYRVGDFPMAEAASQEVLSLPCYPELPAEHQTRIVKAIQEFYS